LYLLDLLPWLLWRRLSIQRAFDLPVTVLEELHGKQRRNRLQTLHGKYTDTAFVNQLVTFLFEFITCIGLAMTINFLVPDTLGIEFNDTSGSLTLVGWWLYSICAFIAMAVVMPFHNMAGFALYLNRRIELEAWDIEITFRNLAERKRDVAASSLALLLPLLVSLLLGASLLPGKVYAVEQLDRQSARNLIEEILQEDDFGGEETRSKWRFRGMSEEDKERIPQWFIDLLEWLEEKLDFSSDTDIDSDLFTPADWTKILLIALFVVLLVYLLYRYRVPLRHLARRQHRESRPEVLFGLDVTPESLPEDVPSQVMRLWQEKQHREALALLYRAALSRLIEHYQLAFKASHTEAECAELVRAQGIDSLTGYFNRLTYVWRHMAYGHELPEQKVLQQLCEQWPQEMKDAG
jgi:hypothetical protein